MPKLNVPKGAHPNTPVFGIRGDIEVSAGRGLRPASEETLWIFDADFEDLSGDNLGWLSLDMSGTLEQVNYWHKDTIRINGFEHLGDSTWWCGTYDDCWRQPRGYGNNWICNLERAFPEVAAMTDPGDVLTLEWDQRFALELDYDYGYVDVSDDGGETWTTVVSFTNWGFAGTPGRSFDWDATCTCHGGHQVRDLSAWAGLEISLRFRVESDEVYSSQDSYNNPPLNSCLDGAWQLDNIHLWTGEEEDPTTIFLDDCEAPGDNGWEHENVPASGQVGVVFERVYDPDYFHPNCYIPRHRWWMSAVDPETETMVDGQASWLISPPIDISGAEYVIAQWEAWVDCPRPSNDVFDLWLSCGDQAECVLYLDSFWDEHIGSWYGGPYWGKWTDVWDPYAGGDWLAINWRLWNEYPAEPGSHRAGFALDRQRVGLPVGGHPTRWDYYIWTRFYDTFDVNDALYHTAELKLSDGDGIESALVVVSSDSGQSWESYPLEPQGWSDEWWYVPPPVDHIAPSTEIRLYFEATDGVGNVRVHPKEAPDEYYEFSILPIAGGVSDPCVLLVDKHGRASPGQDRRGGHTSEYFYREALDILGYEYDVFDVNVPSGSILSEGPDTSGMKYYDTQIWFTNEFNAYTLWPTDQLNLMAWLGESAEGKERNLLLTGNDIGQELIEYGKDTLGFYPDWLGSEYVQNDVGTVSDTMPILRDAAGGFDFMTFDDRQCHLWDDW